MIELLDEKRQAPAMAAGSALPAKSTASLEKVEKIQQIQKSILELTNATKALQEAAKDVRAMFESGGLSNSLYASIDRQASVIKYEVDAWRDLLDAMGEEYGLDLDAKAVSQTSQQDVQETKGAAPMVEQEWKDIRPTFFM